MLVGCESRAYFIRLFVWQSHEAVITGAVKYLLFVILVGEIPHII